MLHRLVKCPGWKPFQRQEMATCRGLYHLAATTEVLASQEHNSCYLFYICHPQKSFSNLRDSIFPFSLDSHYLKTEWEPA